jgi:MFS family permease
MDKCCKEPEKKDRIFYGYIVVSAAFLIMVVTLSTRYSFGVFFKPMIAEFGWTRAMTSGVFSLAWIMECIMSFVLGGLNDKLGPRKIMTMCGIVSGCGYLLMAQINDLTQLYLVYGILIGAGTSVYAPLVSTTARWFVNRRTVMTGIVIAGIGIGSLIWPPVIEQIVSISDWRMACIVIGCAILIVAIPSAQFLKGDPSQIGQKALGDRVSAKERLQLIKSDFTLKEAVSTSQFWIFFVVQISYGYGLMSIQTHLVPYITDLSIPAATAAAILAVSGGCSVLGRVFLGSIGDKIGNKRTFAACIALMLISVVWLLIAKTVWGFYLFGAVLGIAYGGLSAQLSPLTAKFFGLRSLGLIFGFVAVGFTLGSAIGPFVSGYIFDLTGSYQLAFLFCGIIVLVGLILSSFLVPTRIKPIGKL